MGNLVATRKWSRRKWGTVKRTKTFQNLIHRCWKSKGKKSRKKREHWEESMRDEKWILGKQRKAFMELKHRPKLAKIDPHSNPEYRKVGLTKTLEKRYEQKKWTWKKKRKFENLVNKRKIT